jgi:ribonuclease R
VERESIRIKQIEYMGDKLGEEYEGLISGVVPFGFFVRLDNLLAEGLVRVSSLEDDYYIYDEKRHRWVGRHNKKIFKLGDRVKVLVVRVDKEEKEIDFVLVNNKFYPSFKRKKRGRKNIKKTKR